MNAYGAKTPDGKFAFSAQQGVDVPRQRELVRPSRILSDEELDFYVQEYSRHGLRGPLNWYRTQELNYMDDLKFFFDGGKDVKKEAGGGAKLFVCAGDEGPGAEAVDGS